MSNVVESVQDAFIISEEDFTICASIRRQAAAVIQDPKILACFNVASTPLMPSTTLSLTNPSSLTTTRLSSYLKTKN